MNNIVRIMLRKGILTDLARVSHYLDLSSPNMPASVNAALKPLETLSRIVNQPTAATNNKAAKQKVQGSVSEEPAGDQTGPVFNMTSSMYIPKYLQWALDLRTQFVSEGWS
jgi:E3 ubiquitin-protein ligase HUWE1